jgi:peptide/nickel transport system substrate-binding protein
MSKQRTRGFWIYWCAALAVLGLLAVGCGGSDDSGDDAGSGGAATEAEPQTGGKVVYAVVSDADGWSPPSNRWTPGGLDIARAVFDPLAAFDADGVPQPYLAESITPNEDFTQWTITLREGVKFHNGDLLTADIVAENLEATRASALIGQSFRSVSSVEAVSDLEVVVTMSETWATFPVLIAQQPGFIAHPSTLSGETTDPVGTGPFVFESWSPGASFDAVRNDEYWRTDDAGNALPYLDAVEFQVISDSASREAGLQSGDIDIMQTNAPSTLVNYGPDLDVGEGYYDVSTSDTSDEAFIALNTQTGPTANPTLREALTLATDRETLNEQLYEGFFTLATSPFPEGSPWFSEVDWPTYDPERASELVEQIKAEGGETSVSFTAGTDTETLALAQAIEVQWEEVGIDVDIQSLDATAITLAMVTGDFETAYIALFNSSDPDGDYHFLDPANITDDGEFSLNFTRYGSDELKANLDAGRSTDVVEDRAAAYAKVWDELAAELPLIWLWHTTYVVVANDSVPGLDAMTLPDGEPAQLVNWGSVFLTEAWRVG